MLPLKPDADGQLHARRASSPPAACSARPPGRLPRDRATAASTPSTPARRRRRARAARWATSPTAAPASPALVRHGHAAADRRGAGDLRRRPRRGGRARDARSRSSRPSSSTPRPRQWRAVAKQNRPRTYHNTAALLPDGRVLVGGHAPISNSYLRNMTLPGGVTAPNDGVTRRSRSTARRTCRAPARRPTSSRSAAAATRCTIDHRRAGRRDRERRAGAQPVDHPHRRRRPAQRRAAGCSRASGNTVTVAQAAERERAARPARTCCSSTARSAAALKPGKATQVSPPGGGLITPASGCLARRSPIGPRNIGRVRLGRTRSKLLADRVWPRSARRARAPGLPLLHQGRQGPRDRGVWPRRKGGFGDHERVARTATAVSVRAEGAPGRSAFPRACASVTTVYRVGKRRPAPDGRAQGQGALLRGGGKRPAEEQERGLLQAYVRRAGLSSGSHDRGIRRPGCWRRPPPAPARPRGGTRVRARREHADDPSPGSTTSPRDVPGLDIAIVRDQAAAAAGDQPHRPRVPGPGQGR